MKYKYTTEQLAKMCGNPWLTDRERLVFKLYYRRGWEIERIAAELDCSRSTIKNLLKSIRDKNRDVA